MKLNFLKMTLMALPLLGVYACDSDSPSGPDNPPAHNEGSSSSQAMTSKSSDSNAGLSSSLKISSATENNPKISSSSNDLTKNSSSSVVCMVEVQSHVVVSNLSEYIIPGETTCKEGIIVFANKEMLLATCKNNSWDTTVVVPCSDTQKELSSSSNANGSFSYADSSYSWQFGNPDVKYGTFIDKRNNHIYRTVTLGTQTWMAENLNFGDEKTIYYYDDYSCYRGNLERWEIDYACDLTGGYYEWTVALAIPYDYTKKIPEEGLIKTPHQGICPDGWHIPTVAEWETLFEYVAANNGGDSVATSLKSRNIPTENLDYEARQFANLFNWSGNDVPSGKDSFGFAAIPNGYMLGDVAKENSPMGYYERNAKASFWTIGKNASSDEKWGDVITLTRDSESVIFDEGKKEYRRNIRCLSD